MRKISKQVTRVSVNRDGPYNGKKPASVKFGEHAFPVFEWTIMLQTMCDTIAAENPSDFNNVGAFILGPRLAYFRPFAEMIRDDPDGETRPHKIGTTSIGVRCNLSANNTFALCNALSQHFGYGQVVVQLRERRRRY